MKRLALIAAIAPFGIAAAQQASFQGIGDIPGGAFESVVHGVSADGLVVVGSSLASPNRVPVRWTAADGLVSLEPEPFGLFQWYAAAASTDGSAIVGSFEATGGSHAFRWTPATGVVDLGDLPGGAFWAAANGVSGDGSIVVGTSDAGVVVGGPPNAYTAFRWTQSEGMHTFLPGPAWSSAADISDDGSTIVGYQGPAAYRWTASTGVQSLAIEASATAVSGDGSSVVGSAFFGCGAVYFAAVRWGQGGGCLTTGTGHLYSSAAAISADGATALAWSSAAVGEQTLLIWNAAQGARPLRGVLEDDYGLDLAGWQLTGARGLSADGSVIVGTGVNPCGQTEGWVARLGTPACSPDCNADGSLTVADFGCFQTRFVASDRYADCTRDCLFTVADFGCFQTKYVLGCR